jgi:hypothetical protein
MKRGADFKDLGVQLDYVNHELNGPEANAGNALRQASDAATATKIFSELYERPGKPMMNSRLSHARNLLGELGNWIGPSSAEAAGPPKKFNPADFEIVSADQGGFNPGDYEVTTGNFFTQEEALQGMQGLDLGFGLSPEFDDLTAQAGRVYQKVREYLGLTNEPWKPSPVLIKIQEDFLRQPYLGYPGLSEEERQSADLASAIAGGIPLGIAGEDLLYSEGRRKDFVESETHRVMGRFVDGYTMSITEGLKKAALGDTYKPETPLGIALGEGAYLLGQIAGPFKLVKGLTGKYLFPTPEGLRTTAQILWHGMKEGAVSLGVLQGLSRIIPAMIENDDVTKFAKDVVSSTKSGALVGAAFPLLGIIPGQGAVGKALRMSTGFAAMDYMRAAPGKWSTLGDFYQAFQTWDDESKKHFAELSYQYLVDIYFAAKVPPLNQLVKMHNQNVILDELSKLNPREIENDILSVTGQRGKWFYDEKGEVAGKGEIRAAEPEKPVNYGQVASAIRRATEEYGAPFDEGLNDRISKAVTEALTPSLVTPTETAGPRVIVTPSSLREINPEIPERIEIVLPPELVGKGGSVSPDILRTWEDFQRTEFGRNRAIQLAQIRAEYPGITDAQAEIVLEERGFGIRKPPQAPTPPQEAPVLAARVSGRAVPERSVERAVAPPTAPELTPEALTARNALAKSRGLDPESLTYIGESELGHYFNVKLPDGGETTLSWKAQKEAPDVAKSATGERRGYNLDRALEHYDLPTIIKAYGGFASDAQILKNFAPEERRRLQLLSRKGAQGPDSLFDELKTNHPDQFPFVDEADMLRSLVDGRAQRMLNRKSIEETLREHYADIEEQARSEGITSEGLAKARSDVERRSAAEEAAGEDPWADAEAAWLKKQQAKTSALETRLDALQAEYPNLDREKAAQVIRSLPDAPDNQIAAMVQDPAGKLFYSGGPDTSTILSGLKEKVSGAKQWWTDLKDNLRDIIAPKGPKEVRQALITMMGRKQENINWAAYQLLEFRDMFSKTPPEEWAKLASFWQAGKKSGSDLDRAFEVYHNLSDALVPQIREYRDLQYQDNYLRQAWKNGRKPEFKENINNFLRGKPFDNYLDLDASGNPRKYQATFNDSGGYEVNPYLGAAETPGLAPGEYVPGLRSGPGGRTLTGGRGYFKKKVISDWQTGMMLGGVPKFKNLFDLMMWDIGEKNQFIWGNKFVAWAKENGYLKYAKGREIPVDWAKIQDPLGLVTIPYLKEIEETRPFEQMPGDYNMTKPEQEARAVQYHLVAPQEAAKLINNWLSPGLRGQPFYEGYRKIIDPLRTLGVSFSTFHLRFTMNNALSTGTGKALSKSMGALLAGDYETAAKAAAEGAVNLSGKRFIEQLKQGKELTHAFYEGTEDPVLKQTLREYIDAGGTLPAPDAMLPMIKTSGKAMWEGLVELGRLHPFSAAGKYIEATARPVMTYGVPFAKIGAFSVLRRALSEKLDTKYGDMKGDFQDLAAKREAEYQQGLFDITKHLDDIYGQMNYDNLLLNRKIKDLLFFVIKFPGWNIGSGRYLAGKVSGLIKTVQGKETSFYEQESLRNGLGMMVNLGIYSTLMYWLINGQAPDNYLELYTKGIWTGSYTKSGNKEYVRDATYWRDIWGMAPVDQNLSFTPHKPIETITAKAADIWRIPKEIFENKEAWSGYEIASPNHPERWLKEYGAYIGKQLLPYSVRGMMQSSSPWGQYGSFVGMTPTPARLTSSPAQVEMRRIQGAQAPQLVTTEKQAGRKTKRDIMEYAYQGDFGAFTQALNTARAQGEITATQHKNYMKDATEIIRNPQYGPLRNSFRKLTDLGDAIKVYSLATEEEKFYLHDIMQKKWTNAKTDTRQKYQQDFIEMKRAMNQ